MCGYWSNSFLTSLSNIYFFNISITLINLYSLHPCLFLHLFHHSVWKLAQHQTTLHICILIRCCSSIIYTEIGKCWVWSGCKIHSLKFSSKNCCEMWILQSSVGRQISWFSFAYCNDIRLTETFFNFFNGIMGLLLLLWWFTRLQINEHVYVSEFDMQHFLLEMKCSKNMCKI